MGDAILRGLNEEKYELWDGNDCRVCMKGARILFRKPCRREYVENVVIELTEKTFRRLVKEEWVTLGMISVCVKECLVLAICFKCSGFGHTGRNWREQACC